MILDGVIGPWFLPLLREELKGLESLSYVVLRASESVALRRVRTREGPGASATVRHMVSAFENLGDFRSHAVDTEERTSEEVHEIVLENLLSGRFRLSDPI